MAQLLGEESVAMASHDLSMVADAQLSTLCAEKV